MLNFISKIVLIMTINLLVSIPLYAQLVEQKKINFPVKIERLMKGEIHFYFEIISPRKLAVQYPEAFELDSLSLNQEINVQMVLTKSVSVVEKPVGFFEQNQMADEKYLNHVMGEQKVKKLNPSSFLVTVPGKDGFNYKMTRYFDSDDVSTLPNTKVIRAVTAAKKLDVISQSASSIMFSEFTNYTKYTEGGVAVSSFIPLKENKTLVITYNMWAVKKDSADRNKLKENVLNEILAVKGLLDTYQ